MSVDDVLAEIERKYGPGLDGYPSATTRRNLKGVPYVTIAGSSVKKEGAPIQGMSPLGEIDTAAQAFLKAVDAYAERAKKPGMRLIWRVRPQLRTSESATKCYYRARFCFEAPD